MQDAHEPRIGHAAHGDASERVLVELGQSDDAETEARHVAQAREDLGPAAVHRHDDEVRHRLLHDSLQLPHRAQNRGACNGKRRFAIVVDDADRGERNPVVAGQQVDQLRSALPPDEQDPAAEHCEAGLCGLRPQNDAEDEQRQDHDFPAVAHARQPEARPTGHREPGECRERGHAEAAGDHLHRAERPLDQMRAEDPRGGEHGAGRNGLLLRALECRSDCQRGEEDQDAA